MNVVTSLGCLLISCSAIAQPLCIAHKGDHKIFPENSLAAMISAYQRGADGVEVDVRHTVEGIPIIHHDFFLLRTVTSRKGHHCPFGGSISNLSRSQIVDNCDLAHGERIPTLQEVLDAFRGKKFILMLELKDAPNIGTRQMISEYDRPEQIRIVSHWDRHLNQFVNLEFKHIEPIKKLKISKYWPRPNEKYGNAMWMPFRPLLDSRSKLRQRETALFPVDSAEDMAIAKRFDVNFVITDDVSLCPGNQIQRPNYLQRVKPTAAMRSTPRPR